MESKAVLFAWKVLLKFTFYRWTNWKRRTGNSSSKLLMWGERDQAVLSLLDSWLPCMVQVAEWKMVWSSTDLVMVMSQDIQNVVTQQNTGFVDWLLLY